jgi:hypothetical protein
VNNVRYTARFPTPHLIERGSDSIVECPVYRDDVLVLPTAGQLLVYNQAGTLVSSNLVVTFPGNVAAATIPASLTEALTTAEEGWRCEWLLTIAGAVVRFRNKACVCKYRLYPTIAGVDVTQRLRALDTSLPAVITTRTSYQSAIDEADIEVQNRMIKLGKRPWLVSEPSALREVWLFCTIAIVLESMAVQNAEFRAVAADWRAKFEAEFSSASTTFDYDDDGHTSEPEKREAVKVGTVWAC